MRSRKSTYDIIKMLNNREITEKKNKYKDKRQGLYTKYTYKFIASKVKQ